MNLVEECRARLRDSFDEAMRIAEKARIARNLKTLDIPFILAELNDSQDFILKDLPASISAKEYTTILKALINYNLKLRKRITKKEAN